MPQFKKNISPKKATAILLAEGLRVNEEQAKYVIDYLYALAILSFNKIKA